jgi:hypothetical protein
MGPITAVPWDDHEATWCLTAAQKRALFGKLGRIPVGGRVADADTIGDKPTVRRDQHAQEPFCCYCC